MTLQLYVCGRQPLWLDRLIRQSASRIAPAGKDVGILMIAPRRQVDPAGLRRIVHGHEITLAVVADAATDRLLGLPVDAAVTVQRAEPLCRAADRIALALEASGVAVRGLDRSSSTARWLTAPRCRVPTVPAAVAARQCLG